MSTGFTLPTTITKRVKNYPAGVTTNDVLYPCPANCVTDVYLHDFYGTVVFNITSISVVRAGLTAPLTRAIAPLQVTGPAATAIVFASVATAGPAIIQESADSFSNAIVGTELDPQVTGSSSGIIKKVGSVIRLFPSDYIIVSTNGIGGTGQISFSTIETFGQ